MLRDRLERGRALLSHTGTATLSIDDAELHRIRELLDEVFGPNELAKLIWDRNRKNDARFFSVGHEYMLVYAKNYDHLRSSGVSFREPKPGIAEAEAYFGRLCEQYGDDWDSIRREWLAWFEDIPKSDPRRRLARFSKVGPRGPYRDDGDVSWPGGGGPRYEVLHPKTGKPCRVPARGWMYPTPERFWEEVETGRVVFGPDETTSPGVARYLFEDEGQVMPSVFYSYAQTASQQFDSLFGFRAFDNPKHWPDIARIARYLGGERSYVLDYFAGSGTTAHAVIDLNREDGGDRKYILVEMGEYFDTVLMPRIQKVVFAEEWKDGVPQFGEDGASGGVSHMFKYQRLESYEDALNNIELEPLDVEQHQLPNDYMLGYMLDMESRESPSLLNRDAFTKPFEYRLKIQRGEVTPRPTVVDLQETFHYLIGMRVEKMEVHEHQGREYRVSRGQVPGPSGLESAVVVWRNLEPELDYEQEQDWAREELLEEPVDRVYVNGPSGITGYDRIEHVFRAKMDPAYGGKA